MIGLNFRLPMSMSLLLRRFQGFLVLGRKMKDERWMEKLSATVRVTSYMYSLTLRTWSVTGKIENDEQEEEEDGKEIIYKLDQLANRQERLRD